MADIVATIQAEQDHVIRAPHGGVLVVQGGAGTGKTAVALHRAAYLLYTYRQQLRAARRAGGRARTRRSCATSATCCPRSARPPSCWHRSPACSLASPRTGRSRRRSPRSRAGRRWPTCWRPRSRTASASRTERWCCSSTGRGCGSRPRRSGAPAPRPGAPGGRTTRPGRCSSEQFVAAVAAEYAADLGERSGAGRSLAGVAGELDLDLLTAQLGDHEAVLDALDELWPSLTPQRLLAELLRSSERMVHAGLSEVDAERLRRDPDGGWTAADVPLLDEAAELLGVDDRAAARWPRPAGGRRSSRRRTCWTSSPARRPRRPTTSATWRTPTDCPLWTSSTRPGWPSGRRSSTTASWPSGPPTTAPGRTGTWSWTRRRSCRRWPGGC